MFDIHEISKSVLMTINDDSMSPAFVAGEEIVIDPTVKPEQDDFVLVQMTNGEQLFRCYRPRGKGTFDLVAENAAWKTVSVTDAASVTILGTMIEHRRGKHRAGAAPRMTAAVEHAADAIVALINSRPQSPTKGELVEVILDNFGAGVSPRSKRLNTVGEIISCLGGLAAVADRTGLTARQLESWLADDQIPPGWHMRLVLWAQSEGYAISPNALGLTADGRPSRISVAEISHLLDDSATP
jgi:hypothetical protein